MFVILTYDVGEKRVAKVLKKCRQYLTWVQNSVFEGDITQGDMKKLKMELMRIMRINEDSLIIYTLANTRYTNREVIGVDKNSQSIIL